MGRIPDSFIDDLNDRVDIAEVVGARVELKKAGREFKGLCPFHGEKTPSFHVVPEKGFYHCFGCGAHGTALGFLMEHDRMEFREAVEALASMAGLEIPEEATAGSAPRDEKRSKLLDVVDRADRWFRQQLRHHPEADRAVAYLKQRGLDGETARTFGIGYAPPGYHNLLEGLGGGEQLQKLLLEAGLLKTSDRGGEPYDGFRDRIIFPIRDRRGRTIAFGGRVLGDEKPKYLNSPETPLFHKGRELYGLHECRRAVKDPERVLLVEGYMDVVGLAQAGIPEVCAALGTAATEEHLRKLFSIAPEVVFCFDGDAAGTRAAFKAVNTALDVLEDGVSIRLLFLPDGEDPDTLVRKEGQAEFRRRLAQAVPLSEYLFAALSKDLDVTVIDGRSRLADRALPLIDRIPGPVFRTLMRSRLAEITHIPPGELDGILRARSPRRDDPPPDAFAGLEPTPRAEDVPPEIDPETLLDRPPPRRTPARNGGRVRRSKEDTAAMLLLRWPELACSVPEERRRRLLAFDREGMEVLQSLLEHLGETPDASAAALLAAHTGTPLHGELLRLAGAEIMLGRDAMQREFEEALARLDEEAVAARRVALMARIRAGDATDAEIREHLDLKRAATGLAAAREQGAGPTTVP
ncbi:MAG: DNA primase [Pseudomonadales bacterium]|jgi:DNA primase|nr:DNA primase [Pseudomonadales bacterium]